MLRVHISKKPLGLNHALMLYFEKSSDYCRRQKYECRFSVLSGQERHLWNIESEQKHVSFGYYSPPPPWGVQLPLWRYTCTLIRRAAAMGVCFKAKEKYRGMFEIQKSGNKTSSGEIGLDIRTHASPKVGQDQVSGGVSAPYRHVTPIADALWKAIFGEMSDSIKM